MGRGIVRVSHSRSGMGTLFRSSASEDVFTLHLVLHPGYGHKMLCSSLIRARPVDSASRRCGSGVDGVWERGRDGDERGDVPGSEGIDPAHDHAENDMRVILRPRVHSCGESQFTCVHRIVDKCG